METRETPDETLRAWIAAADPRRPWSGIDAENDARLSELACAAPALAAEVLRLRGLHEDAAAAHERLAIRAWGAVLDDHDDPPASEDALIEGIELLRAERDALRAIVEGRTTPPTAAEIEAHHAAGGVWLLRWPWREGVWACAVCWRGVRDEWMPGAVCIALDAERRPRAWPEVAR